METRWVLILTLASMLWIQTNAQDRDEADVAIALHVAKNVKIRNIKNYLHPFLLDLIKTADVNSGAVRFSITVFGPDTEVQFGFDKFNNKAKLIKALRRLKPKLIRKPLPNTPKLFDVLSSTVYSETNGDRPQVPNFLIFITDQKSTGNAKIVQDKAAELKATGTKIFTIGLTRANKNELKGIASDPAEDFYFSSAYADLANDELKNKLGESFFAFKTLKTVEITTQPPTTTTERTTTTTTKTTETTTTTEVPVTTPAKSFVWPLSGSEEADIVIALHLSPRTTEFEFMMALNYLRTLIAGVDVETGRVQIGFMYYNADAEVIFHINQYTSMEDIENVISSISPEKRSFRVDASSAIGLARQMLSSYFNRREWVPAALIFITDAASTENADLLVSERDRAQRDGINIFSIGVGLRDKSELEMLATAPENVMTVSRVQELDSTIEEIKEKMFAFRTRVSGTDSPGPVRTVPLPTEEPPIRITLPSSRVGCGLAKTDLVIILDASTSVTEANFQKMRDFVKEFLSAADINSGSVRVGILIYSTEVQIVFYLDDFSTSAQINAAVDDIPYIYGSTNTADSLKSMREELFDPARGDRPDAPNIAIILTDGVSNINSRRTIPEAETSRNQNIHIYAIGIGLTDTRELDGIASKPASSNSFNVRDFDELKGLPQKIFSGVLCPASTTTTTTTPTTTTTTTTTTTSTTPTTTTTTTTPTTTTTTTTTPKPPRTDGYDVIFILDSSVTPARFRWMLNYARGVVREMSIDDEEFRVGFLIYSNGAYRQFYLNDQLTKAEVLRGIDSIGYRPGNKNTAAALKYVRKRMFVPRYGDRDFAKNYVIMLTGEGASTDPFAAATEACELQADGVGMFSVGFGEISDLRELDAYSSNPTSRYEILIRSEREMGETPGQMLYNLKTGRPRATPCPTKPPPTTTTRRPGPIKCTATGDVVFVLDSSGSVGQDNFYRVLNFTYQTVEGLDIDSGQFRVGVETFSDTSRLEFNLGDFSKREEIERALQDVNYVYGNTHTAHALRRARTEMFTAPAGDRPDIPNVAVIITDGQSNVNHELTLPEARALKSAGVTIITVAVGFTSETAELVGLTSPPVSENLIYVSDYESLDKLKDQLIDPLCSDSDLCRNNPCQNGAICMDGIRSFTCLCPTDYFGETCNKRCGEPADVVIVLDSSTTVGEYNFGRLKEYAEHLVREMNKDACDINLGFMKYSSAAMPQVTLGMHSDAETNIRALDSISYSRGRANMAAAFRSLRTDFFNGQNGDRPNARNIAYFLTDGTNDVNAAMAETEAELTIGSGVRVIPIGINMRMRYDLENIAHLQGIDLIEIDDEPGLMENTDIILNPIYEGNDFCAGDPCRNAGTCINEPFGYSCECDIGYTGDNCEKRCMAKGDVVFAVDTSRYVNRQELKLIRRFLRSVVKRIRFKKNAFSVGLVQFSDWTRVVMDFDQGNTKKKAKAQIATLRVHGGDPNPAQALAKANYRIFKGRGADRERPDYLILITKSMRNERQLLEEANKLKVKGTRILGIGIGLTESEEDYLKSAVSMPYRDTAMVAKSASELRGIADKVVEYMCEDENLCATNPCKNGGTCQRIGGDFYCECGFGFAGRYCENRCNARADVVFLLDSSGSVGHMDFRRIKQFAAGMVSELSIGRDHTRVGLATYSSRSRHGFFLSEYYDVFDLQNAIAGIGYQYGNTNTAAGLRLVREHYFNNGHGDREDIQNFLIVITDGVSNVLPDQTLVEAELLKRQGVHIYAIGIGQFDAFEINAIASEPSSENAFVLKDYTLLKDISSSIVKQTCRDPTVCDDNPCKNGAFCIPGINGPFCECLSGFRGEFCEQSCVTTKDIMFLLDSSDSVGESNFKLALKFIYEIIEEFSTKDSYNRFALITFSDEVQIVFSLGRYNELRIIRNAVKYTRYRPGSTNTAGALRVAEEISTATYGDRRDAENIVFLITDGQSNVREYDTIPAAEAVKNLGARIITIGVNLNDMTEVERIASSENDVYRIGSFANLEDIKEDILARSCKNGEELKAEE